CGAGACKPLIVHVGLTVRCYSNGRFRPMLLPEVNMRTLRAVVVILALLALLTLLIAGPGTRLGLWDFRLGFTLMRWAVYGGAGAAALAIALLLIPTTRRGGAAGLVA